MQRLVTIAHCVNPESVIVAARLEYGLSSAREMLQEFVDVEGRIAIGWTSWIRVVDYAVIAVLAPSIQRRAVVVSRLRTVAKVPPEETIKLGLHDVSQAVRHEQSVDEAGRLFPRIAVNRV